jgi:hypothetical protein
VHQQQQQQQRPPPAARPPRTLGVLLVALAGTPGVVHQRPATAPGVQTPPKVQQQQQQQAVATRGAAAAQQHQLPPLGAVAGATAPAPRQQQRRQPTVAAGAAAGRQQAGPRRKVSHSPRWLPASRRRPQQLQQTRWVPAATVCAGTASLAPVQQHANPHPMQCP